MKLEVSLPLLFPNFFWRWTSEVGGFSSLTCPKKSFGGGLVRLEVSQVSLPLLVPKIIWRWISEVGGFSSITGPIFFGGGLVRLEVYLP